jgi:tetratricopeptide (TPR) repeat protein
MNSGNAEKSLIYFRKASKLDSDNPEAWYLQGKAHYMLGGKKEAMKCFREALRLDSFYDEAWADLGRVIVTENIIVKALPFVEQAYKVTGDVPGINYLLASFYLHTDKKEEAYTHLSSALRLDSKVFDEFRDLFPENLLDKKIRKIIEKNKPE